MSYVNVVSWMALDFYSGDFNAWYVRSLFFLPSSLNSDEVYWNKRVWTVPQHSLSYCDISLNAASTMTHHLIDLGGTNRQEVLARFKNDNPSGMGLRSFLKVKKTRNWFLIPCF